MEYPPVRGIFKELREIIQKGRLSAYNSDLLLREQIALIIYYYAEKLGHPYETRSRYLPRLEKIYPIDLGDVKNKIERFRGAYYFQGLGFPRNEIASLVEQAIANKVAFPVMKTTGSFPPFEELFKIVSILMDRGYEILEEHHLPCPDINEVEAEQNCRKNGSIDSSEFRAAQFTEAQARAYAITFFTQLEQCYKEFVDYFFKPYREGFKFYTEIPHEYFFYMKDDEVIKWGSMGLRPSRAGEIGFHFSGGTRTMEDVFKEDGLTSLQHFNMDKILRSDIHHDVRTVDRFNTSDVDDFCVIRNWVYRILKNDFRELFRENGEYI